MPPIIVRPLVFFVPLLCLQNTVLFTMDPLSATASVAGITLAALQSVQTLIKVVESIVDAPTTIAGISADLLAVQTTLQSLSRALQEDSSRILSSKQVKHAVENCQTACKTFQLQVEHWTKHSTKNKMFWVDRWRFGLFGLERTKTFREQLGNCKSTLVVALSTSTTYVCPLLQNHSNIL
jgi:hypothetical protein